MKTSILDRFVPPIGWVIAALLVFSMLPLVAPLFMFEVPDLTQTMVDACASDVDLEPSEMDCEQSAWLRLVAVARHDEALYLALDPETGDEGDWLRLTFPASEYRVERGTRGIWAVFGEDELEAMKIGVVSKTQNGLETLAFSLPGDLSRWAVSTDRSRTPPEGSYGTPQLPGLSDGVALPSWTPWLALAVVLLWGYHVAAPARVVVWTRWLIFLCLVWWAVGATKPHLDESLGRLATSPNYPILVPIGIAAFMVLGVPWLAHVVAKAVSRRLPRWSVLAGTHEPRPSDSVAVKVIGSVLLAALVFVALQAADGAIGRLFPGFTI